MLQAYAALAGKKAVVIGGATGIGRAIVRQLADAGVAIATCDKDVDGVAAIGSEIKSLGATILSLYADVREVDALDAFLDHVEDEFDHVDILVNLPGGTERRGFVESTRGHDAENIRLNLGYALDTIRRLIPLMRKNGHGGAIVNFTTIEAHRGAAGYAVYAAAKAGLTNFSRALAVELGKEQIRVNVVAPDASPSTAYTKWQGAGGVRVARFAGLSDEVREAAVRMHVPQQRPPGIEDIADAVLFLVSDMARTITGQTIHVDGGTSAAMGFLDWPFGEGHGPAPPPEILRRLFE
jgi:NAD(P)-dependent dehydrogenase (short-subunit alcohol dehydrogenase family)